MMNQNDESCEDIRDLLYLFVSRELEPDEVEMVVRHLAGCQECQEALIQHAKLSKYLGKSAANVPVSYYSINA